ncbi:MAG: response regulator [Bacteroidetes bacterium]|nr:response regulator [Bacteroidota bacterium]
MTTYRCLIVDDEPIARQGLIEFVDRNPDLVCHAVAKNAAEASKILNSQPIDIVFLDIEMPRTTGIELLESQSIKPAVVITSAYDQYAIKGFELDVQDYLLKPFSYDRFCHGSEKAIQFLKNNDSAGKSPNNDVVYIRAEGVLHRVDLDDLLFIEGMQNYMICHTRDKRLITHITMKALQEQLPDEIFVRTHKSYLANIHAIERIDGNDAIIGEFRIPMSRNYKDEAKSRIVGDQLLNR